MPVDIEYYISFRCPAQGLDIHISYKVIPPISLVPPVPCIVIAVLLTDNYNIFPRLDVHPWDHFVTANLYFLIPSPFHPAPTSPPLRMPIRCKILWCLTKTMASLDLILVPISCYSNSQPPEPQIQVIAAAPSLSILIFLLPSPD